MDYLTDLSQEELKAKLEYNPQTGVFTWKDIKYKHSNIAGSNRGVQINNVLGVKGVSSSGNKYVARIGIKGITYYLGTFETIEEAVNARREAEAEFFGEHAYQEKTR